MTNANSTEFDPETPYPVIALVTEWTECRSAQIEQRHEKSDKGGTMRLGGQAVSLSSRIHWR